MKFKHLKLSTIAIALFSISVANVPQAVSFEQIEPAKVEKSSSILSQSKTANHWLAYPLCQNLPLVKAKKPKRTFVKVY